MHRNGFTLIELMVVILLMALIAGAVMITVDSSGKGPSAEAARLAGRLAAARDSAVIGARPVSFWTSRSGYGFDTFAGGGWSPLKLKPFEATDWSRGTRVDAGVPQGGARGRLTFDSLGLPERPYSLRLERDGKRARIDVAANGDVSVS